MSESKEQHTEPCPDCHNSQGYSGAAYHVGKALQPLMWNMPDSSDGRAEYERITVFLCGRAPDSWGHDETDLRAAVRKLAELAGVQDVQAWETCPTCKGSGEVAALALAEKES